MQCDMRHMQRDDEMQRDSRPRRVDNNDDGNSVRRSGRMKFPSPLSRSAWLTCMVAALFAELFLHSKLVLAGRRRSTLLPITASRRGLGTARGGCFLTGTPHCRPQRRTPLDRSIVSTFSITALETRRMSSTFPSSSLPPLIDVDCNLWHDDLQQPLLLSSCTTPDNEDYPSLEILSHDAVIEQNIVAVLSPSSTLQESRLGLELLRTRVHRSVMSSSNDDTEQSLQIRTTVGIHPYYVNDDDTTTVEDAMETLGDLLQNYKNGIRFAAAVGECGLDASEGFPPLEQQIPYFEAQVALANTHKLPLFVHERLAFGETMEILKDATEVSIIIHCFTGTSEECRQYVERGYHLSVSGFICKEAGADVRQCLQDGLIPLDRLMVETDAPYMGFETCRTHYLNKHADSVELLTSKKRKRLVKGNYPNMPSSLPLVVDAVVDCLNAGRHERGQELLERNEVARQMTKNAVKFFGFDSIEGL